MATETSGWLVARIPMLVIDLNAIKISVWLYLTCVLITNQDLKSNIFLAGEVGGS